MITKCKVKLPEYCNSKEFNGLIQQLIQTELAHLGIINLPFNHITKPVYTKKTVSTFIPVTSQPDGSPEFNPTRAELYFSIWQKDSITSKEFYK